ncbi:MAG: hypothetical protein ACK4TI_03520 [Nitrososphaerales archaeon]
MIDLRRLKESLKAVYEAASKLERGDTVAVCWIDASTSDHVNITKPIPNHNVETKRLNERYIYLGIQAGEEFGDPHIILLKGSLDSEADSTITSIPLYLIKKVVKVGGKLPEEARKLAAAPKIRRIRVITFQDGSVKHFDI